MTSKLCYWFVGDVMKTLKRLEIKKHNIIPGRICIRKKGICQLWKQRKWKLKTANSAPFTEEASGPVTESVLFQRQL